MKRGRSVARATRASARGVCARSSRIARGTAQSAADPEAPLEQYVPIPHLREVVVFLVVAGIVVPLFRRVRVGAVLGFLVVGAVIGPHGLGLAVADIGLLRYAVIEDIEGVRRLSELGVIFLMFTIGLELSFERLWGLRRLVLGLGLAQVVLTAAALGGAALAFGVSPRTAAVLGICLAFSSTAIVMQLLAERRELTTQLGRTCFSILLLQDLAVVPTLFVLGVPGTGAGVAAAVAAAFGKAVAALALIFVVGHTVLRPLLRLASGTRRPELFTAVTLLVVIGTAWATAAAGLSVALGAFLAGLLLAESEYRYEVEVDIEPFKGLLVGLFFMSVGMMIDLRFLAAAPLAITGATVGLVVVKAAIVAALCLVFGLPRGAALETGLLLGQAGEFAIVVVGIAAARELVPTDTAQVVLFLAATTMLATPVIAAIGRRAAARLAHRERRERADEPIAVGPGHVVIAGFGRVGQLLARILDSQGQPYVALDLDGHAVAQCRARGLPVFYGDAGRVEMLRRVRIEDARAFVVTMDDPRAGQHAVHAARRHWPMLPVYARARDAAHARRLLALGATEVVPEATEASLQLGARVLEGLGEPLEAVAHAIELERELELAGIRASRAGGPRAGAGS
jgi:CPA2 family monovalent cation:H+ antiporter-2